MIERRDDNLLIALGVDKWPAFVDKDGVIQEATAHNSFEGSTRFIHYDSCDSSDLLPELYRTKDECCGCSACVSSCPKGALSMFPDIEGFLYPIVDASKCVGCGICCKVCPLK